MKIAFVFVYAFIFIMASALYFRYSVVPKDLLKQAASLVSILGIVGDGFAVGLLIFPFYIKRYTVEKYLKNYTIEAKNCYPSYSEELRSQTLREFYSNLKIELSGILTSDFGVTLTAIATLLTLVGDFVKLG